MKILSSIVFAITICRISAVNEKFPEFMTACDYKEDNLEECVKEQMVKSLPYFAKGLPELGVKPIDPFVLEDIVIEDPHLVITLKEPKLTGLSKVTLKEIQLGYNDVELNFAINFVGDMHMCADYYANGQTIMLPMNSKGRANIDVHKVSVNITSNVAQFKDCDGDVHMKMTNPVYKYDMGSTVFNFENLFDGDEELTESANKFANENWRELMEDVAPSFMKQIGSTIIRNINRFFAKITTHTMLKNHP